MKKLLAFIFILFPSVALTSVMVVEDGAVFALHVWGTVVMMLVVLGFTGLVLYFFVD